MNARRRPRPGRAAVALATLVPALASIGCGHSLLDGGIHRQGEQMTSVYASHGQPIVGKAIAWNGLGDVPNASAGLAHHWFLRDRLALGAQVTGLLYDLPGDTTHGLEVEGGLRWFLFEPGGAGLFWDWTGGFQHTAHYTPPGGTRDNFTFSFGPGLEVPLGGRWRAFASGEFHHMSNALGRESPRNPSMNELLVTVGLGWTW